MTHELKIKQCFLSHILEGKKDFEIRINDRDFQVNDVIHFLPIEDKNYDVYEICSPLPRFKIKYVHQGFGMADGYCALGIERMY